MANLHDVKSILIVEDHSHAGRVLEAVCADTFSTSEVVRAGTVAQSRAILAERRFDLVLLDIGLPDGNGIELIQMAKASPESTRCVMTTIFDDDEHLFDALRAGADGYLIKGHSPEELRAFLIDAVSGKLALSSNIALSILTFFRSTKAPDDEAPGPTAALTSRETEILQLIAKGCQVKEVSNLLAISTNTVSHHIKSIYAKLNVRNRAQATAAAVQLRLLGSD